MIGTRPRERKVLGERKREKWEKGFIGMSGRDWYTAEGEKGLGRKASKGIEVPERKVERKVRSFTGQLGDRQNIGWRTAGFARAGRESESVRGEFSNRFHVQTKWPWAERPTSFHPGFAVREKFRGHAAVLCVWPKRGPKSGELRWRKSKGGEWWETVARKEVPAGREGGPTE